VSAIDAVRQWKYKPYLLNGEPTAVETTVTVNYTLGPDAGEPNAARMEPPPPGSSQSDDHNPVRVSPGVVAGNLISHVNPVYPADAKAAHLQGAVVLRATISKTGTVEELRVVSGPPQLTKSALDAVKQWVYKPYLLNGEPVEVQTTITVNFTFADPAPPPAQGALQEYGGEPVRKIGGGVSSPVPVFESQPEYSKEAKKAKLNGIVLVNLIVDAEGMPQNVHVLRGVGMGLDEKAVEAVQQYKFKPATEGGKPVPVNLNIEVNFKIF